MPEHAQVVDRPLLAPDGWIADVDALLARAANRSSMHFNAPLALGIAVDDTLHFLTWFNREHSETGDNIAGVKLAFRHCAKAMLQTTLICSLGGVVLVACPPVQRGGGDTR